ncbi:glycosyl transferase family 2 [Thalassoporum mexicanum PCC 7367]|uniref:glycosyltransferase family A protein n=1 Tax=Thalassoporum mexicanum TaxID=3457544 RepID=UPI00029FB050|nr:glycosyltransferase family A protein [Pseudanabaena sp. PCC 7367]AFY71825.1 glycosyl transferase family 2 [Pseudanabaena sp. PCC 7367]
MIDAIPQAQNNENPDRDMQHNQGIDISIIVPCFNHGEYLREALASVANYQGNNHEIIIVNDGSTEPGTLQILAELSKNGDRIINQANHGLAHARNTGIAAAQGRYILPLDADNKIRPIYITRGIEVLDQFPAVGIVYGDVAYFGDQNLVWALPDFDLDRLMLGNFIDACAVFRKQVWQDCGGYDQQMPDRLGYEDWDFWLGAAAQGWQFHHLDMVTYDYRVRSDSMVQKCKLPANQQRLVHYICQKHESLYRPKYAAVIAAKELATFEQIQKAEEARLQLAQTQAEVDRLEQELKHIYADKAEQDRPINQLEQQITKLQQKSLAEQQQLGQETLNQLEKLQAELDWMKTSKFWRSRQLFMQIKRKFKTILGFNSKS